MEPTRLLIRLRGEAVRERLLAVLPISADAALVPDPLIRATVRAATRVVRGKLPHGTMSASARGLVEDALWSLAAKRWDVTAS